MPSQVERRAVIVGGGIGGLAAAIALRGRGIDSVVLEGAEQLRDGGAGLHLWTNGVLALAELGVAGPVLRTAPVQRVCEFRTHTGDLLGAWPVSQFEETYGAPTIAISRSHLHQALVQALPADTLRSGARVVSFRQDAQGVDAVLEDGTVERGDVLIGADGLHSAVRRGLFGDTPPRYNGYVAWRGHTRIDDPEIPPGSFRALFGPGLRFTYYDVAPGVVHWMSVANGPAGGRDEPGIVERLQERHSGWMEPVQRLIGATPEDKVIRSDVFDRRPDKTWGRGLVTLLGDAAHPINFNVGQGACQALEDALVLAECLDEEVDTAAALRSYEKERRSRTAALQRLARWIGRMGAMRNPLACRARNAFMKATWDNQAFTGTEKDIAYAARWARSPRTVAVE
ncbi:FAD-dependent monooxygenase [Nocardiopsis oceani]